MTDVFFANYKAKYPNDTSTPSIILAELYPGYTRPYIETRVVAWARKYGAKLKGAIILGGSYH
jgi:hypothetical protein